MREAKHVYVALENETCKLAEFKNETIPIFVLIKRKEQKFGNILSKIYRQVSHSSDLFSLRNEI